jgi:hypothetical protein
MRGNPILNSLRTADAAGYPALLIVSAVCLGLVVAPVALLGLTDAGWVLGLAVLYLIVAVAVLVGAVSAALSDGDEPDAKKRTPAAAHPTSASRSRVRPNAARQPATPATIGGRGAPASGQGDGRRPAARRLRRARRRALARRSFHRT